MQTVMAAEGTEKVVVPQIVRVRARKGVAEVLVPQLLARVRFRNQRVKENRKTDEHEQAADGREYHEGDGKRPKKANCLNQKAHDQAESGNLHSFFQEICAQH
jgi:hypothetical protein